MTAISTAWTPAAGDAAAGSGPGIFTRAMNRVRRQIAVRRNRWILHGLSDRELADIGINRGAIDDVVEGLIDRTGRPRR